MRQELRIAGRSAQGRLDAADPIAIKAFQGKLPDFSHNLISHERIANHSAFLYMAASGFKLRFD